MRIYLSAALAFASFVAQGQTAPPPMDTIIVNSLPSSDTPRDGFTRLRISLTSNESSASENIRLAGIAACTTDMCYESGAPSSVTVSTTANGTSTSIAELEVPHSDIVSVRFKSGAGKGILQGSIGLPEPLKLEKGFRGGDILIVTQKRGLGFAPVAAASNYFQPAGTTFFYNPKFASTVKLPHGVTLSIPVGATQKPFVFLVGVHDTGDEYPRVDIFPEVKLTKSVRVQLPLLERIATATLGGQHPKTPRLQPAPPPGANLKLQTQTVPVNGPMSIDINATGTVPIGPAAAAAIKQSSTLQIEEQSTSTVAVSSSAAAARASAICNSAGWCNCANQLAYPTNQNIISNGLAPTGTVYIKWCTTISPYVHITVTNMADSRERFTIRHGEKVYAGAASNYTPSLPLTKITAWSQYTQVMTNGFYWQGSDGYTSGQYGKADGHVRDFATGIGDNLVVGGSCDDYPTPQYNRCDRFTAAGNKRVMFMPASGTGWWWANNANTGPLSNATSYVSSSTSVVKDGVCQSGTEGARVSRWSAVGNTAGGRLIFMSSTSDEGTSAAELCQVFLSMGAVNAIRLDGGPSAAMTLDGNLLNPLKGLYFAKYGSVRHIPYALKVSYPGW